MWWTASTPGYGSTAAAFGKPHSTSISVDHFFLDDGNRVRSRLTHTPERLGPDPVGGVGTFPVPDELRDRPVLTDAEVRRLAGLGRRIEELFGAPQDIEGAFTADGALHLVQTRPIVVDFALHREWNNANVTKSFPGVTTALTYTFARTFYRSIFYDLDRRLGVPARTLHHDEPYLDRMIGLHMAASTTSSTPGTTCTGGLRQPGRCRSAWPFVVTSYLFLTLQAAAS